MKKIIIICGAMLALALSSCTSTYSYLTTNEYQRTIDAISSDLAEDGYVLSGTEEDSKNEVVVTGVSYSKYTGYGTAMGNDVSYSESYTFSNEATNDELTYTVVHSEVRKSYSEQIPYFTECTMKGCKTKKPATYSKCKTIERKLDNAPRSDIEVYDYAKTYLLSAGLGVLVTVILCLSII